jgi:UDP-2-acetamido-3-amino-2,3-dideoxy-glucuronate N-acetyltransferase
VPKIYHKGDSPPEGLIFVWPETYNPEKDRIIIGDKVKIRAGSSIIYWGTQIGDNSTICHSVIIREYTHIGRYTVIGSLVTIEGRNDIGDYVTLETKCHIVATVKIEDGVFMGPCCVTTNTKKIVHGRSYPLVEEGAVIKFAARIGAGVTICPKLTVGENALIGAGAVVTKDIEARKVALGVPARIVGDVPEEEILTREMIAKKLGLEKF